MNQLYSTGRGGSGNFKVGPDVTSTEQRLSTAAKKPEGSFGRGGAGNIGAVKAIQRRQEVEEEAMKDALGAEKARAYAKAAAESIQYPKPTRSM